MSMTGFGAAEGEVAGRRIRIEVRSVNHRWFNFSARLPADLAAVESALREAVRRRIGRGHVTVAVRWLDAGPMLPPDPERVAALVASLRDLQRRHDLGGEVTVDLVARQLAASGGGEPETPVAWQEVAPTLDAAVAACQQMRQREGEALGADLGDRVNAIGAGCDVIEALAPARLQRERLRLSGEVRRLLGDQPADEWRLTQELALLAERVDIAEELTRLRAHVVAARAALGGEGMGKQLGFLAQEIGRELNTIGSKANDTAIAHEVVRLKGELERFREQLENVE